MVKQPQDRVYPDDVLLIFIGYASDAKQEVQAICGKQQELQDHLDQLNQYNSINAEAFKGFKTIRFFDWEKNADNSAGGQQKKITPNLERADILIFVFRGRIGQVTWDELTQARNDKRNQKQILAFFPESPPPGLDWRNLEIVDGWRDLLAKRKNLTEDWNSENSSSINPILYKTSEILPGIACEKLKTIISKTENQALMQKYQVQESPSIKNIRQFIDELIGRSDYELSLVKNFRSKLRPEIRIKFETMDDLEYLKTEGFIRENSLTITGGLLFTNIPTSFVPSATIKCVRYYGDTKDKDRERHDYQGDLLGQIEKAYEFVKRNTEKKEKPIGDELSSKTVFKFPQVTVREIIANAVCHRDYKTSERQIHVRIYNNAIEIASPGNWFPKDLKENQPIPLSELVSEAVRRNTSLSNALASINILEAEGSGIPTSLNECRQLNAPEPNVIQKDGFVMVKIFPIKDWDNINVSEIIDRSKGKYRRKIFISYSHKDMRWKERLMTHLKVLELSRDCTVWDDQKIGIGEDWFLAITKALDEAQIVVVMISADFLISQFIQNEVIPRILERRKNEGILVLPVLVSPCAWKNVKWLSSLQIMPKGEALSQKTEHEIDDVLVELAQIIFGFMGKPNKPTVVSGAVVSVDNVSLYKLPVTGDRLFGREKELKMLDDAWSDDQTTVLALVAWGGVGKTALVNRWLNQMKTANYCGAQKIFGWSFYSQGAEEGKQASADEFFQETLQWFGDAHPEAGSAVDKGRRLARLARQQKSLLILDGLEPLQYPPGEVTGLEGKLKANGLAAFLKELAGGKAGNKVLCVITTREPVTDLMHRKGYGVTEIPLEHLSETAGVELLKSLGVSTGSPKDFHDAVKEYGGHALVLTLLGQYIKSVHGGDIRRRDEIPQLSKERLRGRHAWRVMEGYEKWFGPSPELNILYLLGLFDRPVEAGTIDALKREPTIPGVTDRLRELSHDDWQWALSHLREARLLAAENPQKPGTLDCHPLVREYFGEKLRQENPAGWQAAHERLYRYFKDLPGKELPDTLAEMEPLFAAVAHGCKAGLHEEALVEVFWKRINRGEEAYTVRKLGAFGSDLACLSHFFAVPWGQPAAGLPDEKKALVLSWAAFRLRALGRLWEAVQPMKAGLEIQAGQKDWKNAASAASNLSELLLTLGDVPGAVAAARQSVTHADQSGDEFSKEAFRCTLADALHQSGAAAEAEQWFREAEAMHQKRQPEYSYLYSLQGYQFCDLLLENHARTPIPGLAQEVMARAEKGLEISKRNGWLLEMALDNLTLGRAWMMGALEKTPAEPSQSDRLARVSHVSRAMTYLEQAVEGLRESGYQYYLPLGLLARAECYRHMKDFANAHDDLAEAREIAELGHMELHLCDVHLEAGRLCEAEGKNDEAKEHFRDAKKLIAETGYGRRKKEKEIINYK